jgi:hypothetical protein
MVFMKKKLKFAEFFFYFSKTPHFLLKPGPYKAVQAPEAAVSIPELSQLRA